MGLYFWACTLRDIEMGRLSVTLDGKETNIEFISFIKNTFISQTFSFEPNLMEKQQKIAILYLDTLIRDIKLKSILNEKEEVFVH